MKLSRILFILCCPLWLAGYSQDTNKLEWPRVIEGNDRQINLYQPQLESLDGNVLKGRMALSVEGKQDDLLFGALWFSARLDTDMEERTALLESLDITKIIFPDIEDDDKMELLKQTIEEDIEKSELLMSLDNIIASLETVADISRMQDQLNHTPPAIYFREKPAVLVFIDGTPILETAEDSKLEYVVNSPFFIVKRKDRFYLKGGTHWYTANDVLSAEWEVTKKVPGNVKKLAEKQFEEAGGENEPGASDEIPEIIVVTEPSELIVVNGKMEYEPIAGTSLLYVKNTESDLLLDIESQHHFLLLSGRWYSTRTLKDMDWQFVEPADLPSEFVKIPADNELFTGLRASIPGTPEAQDAVYEEYIPQTATVDRKTASTSVTYDGAAVFEEIEGSHLKYAVNTQSTVIQDENRYFVVDDGVWFEANDPNGPWIVADSRPDGIDSIPASCPVYNTKYVYIYDSTPEVVYVGYTPGYFHSYVYGGVVVYGTGFIYRPWWGVWYVPRPVTFGWGVHYNPFTGWGFSVGVSYGWMTVRFGRHAWWGPRGFAHGYRHGYWRGYRHGFHNGYRAGYIHGRNASRNAYRTSRNGTRRGVSTRSGTRSNISSRGESPRTRSNTGTRRNDLYADRSGNVHQRNRSGDWEQKRNSQNRSRQSDPANQQRRTPSQYDSRQRSQLDRQYNQRSRGNSNYRNYNNNRSRSNVRSGAGRSGARRRG